MALNYDHDSTQWSERTIRIMQAVHDAKRISRQLYHREMVDGQVTQSQRGLLRVLLRDGHLSMQDLAKRMGLSTPTVSGIVDRLEAKGLVVRERQADDRRSVSVRISDTHIQNIRNSHSIVDKRLDDFFQSLSEEEVGTVCDVLERYSVFMGKELEKKE
jgi:DNA-binding MarR family transcriptional regulator